MRKFTVLAIVAALLIAVILPAQAQGNPPTIASVLADSATADEPQFVTLLAAAQAMGLVPVLDQNGPYTVFAPTDEAFATTLGELDITLEGLLADPEQLTSILLYHIVPGSYVAPQVLDMNGLPLATAYWGSSVTVTVEDEGSVVRINDATVVQTDILASNGVIHAIDRVLIPAEDSGTLAGLPMTGDLNVVELAASNNSADTPEFVTLVTAIEAAGLAGTLGDGGPYTVFAPTDAAFEAFLAENELTIEALLEDTEALATVLAYHVVPLNFYTGDLSGAVDSYLGTLLPGAPLHITRDGGLLINGAAITNSVVANNGVIHTIDRVLVPTTTTQWRELATAPEPEPTEAAPEATEPAAPETEVAPEATETAPVETEAAPEATEPAPETTATPE